MYGNTLYICCINNHTRNVYKSKKRKVNRRYSVHVGTDHHVDDNGEIVSSTPKFREVEVKSKSKFATMYLDDDNLYEALKGLGNAGAVWGFVLVKYDKDNNVFYFSKSVRDQCCQVTGLSDGTVRSAISGFCDSNLLLKLRNAEYMVNPSFFYMGHWDFRQSVIDKYEENKEALETLERNKRIEDKTVKI